MRASALQESGSCGGSLSTQLSTSSLSSRPSFLSLSPPLGLLVGRRGLGERKLGRRLNTEAASPRFGTGTRARQKLLFNQLLYTQTTALEALIYITELKSLTCSCDAFVSVIKYCMPKSHRSRIPKSCCQFQGSKEFDFFDKRWRKGRDPLPDRDRPSEVNVRSLALRADKTN